MSSDNGMILIEADNGQHVVEQYQEGRKVLQRWMQRQVAAMPEKMDPNEAGEYIQALQLSGNLHEDIHLATRFMMGEAARRVKANAEWGDVQETLAELAERFGLGNTNTLRRCINAAETFHGNPQLFARWLVTGQKKRWYDFVDAARAEVDPMALGVEAFQKYIETEQENVQRAAERAEKTAKTIDPEDEDSLREMEGVVTALSVEAADLLRKAREIHREALEGTERDEALIDEALEWYVEAMRVMPCMACGRPAEDNPSGQTEPHHVAPSVTAKKQSHWLRVPLCNEHHTLVHQEGYAAFKRKTGFDIRELTSRMFHLFVTGQDCRFPSGLD